MKDTNYYPFFVVGWSKDSSGITIRTIKTILTFTEVEVKESRALLSCVMVKKHRV